MRLIDAEYVLWKVQSEAFPQSVDFGYGRESVLEEIRNAPTVDAEPVVRCKECKTCHKEDEYELWCNGLGAPARLVRPDDYCSRGAKIEEEHE